MRTLTLFICIALFPILGTAQSVTLSGAFDSTTTTSGCDTVGESIYTYLYGSTTGLNSGDTIDIYVDQDDGNGLTLSAYGIVNSNGNFSPTWGNSWSSPGAKNVMIVGEGPNGNADTLYRTQVISDSCATIQGEIFLDGNSNCTLDGNEELLENKSVKVEYNNSLVGYATTNAAGVYQVQVGANASPYEVTLVDSGYFSMGCPNSATQTVSSPPNHTVDYALNCPGNPDFEVDHGWVWSFRPGFESDIHLGVEGPSYCQDSLECIKMVLDQDLTAMATDSTTPSYDAVNGDTVVWNMDTNNLADFYHGRLPVMTNSNAIVGDSICVEILLCTSNDVDPSNNSMQVCGEIVNSWDPNNKEVMPAGVGPDNVIQENQRMTYTINFQNTGTAPALEVRVEDTIDTDVLDQSSFRFMSSSHNVDKVKIEEDSIFEFHFNNINLPDSGTSQSGSKGYVRFSIDQQPNLSDGTMIENNAAIFFDNNPPVITNETMNKIGEPSSMEDHRDAAELTVYPNPAQDRLHISSEASMEGRAVLRDMVGKRVLTRSLNGSRTTLNVNELPSGVYLLSVHPDGKKEPVRKKVMID